MQAEVCCLHPPAISHGITIPDNYTEAQGSPLQASSLLCSLGGSISVPVPHRVMEAPASLSPLETPSASSSLSLCLAPRGGIRKLLDGKTNPPQHLPCFQWSRYIPAISKVISLLAGIQSKTGVTYHTEDRNP